MSELSKILLGIVLTAMLSAGANMWHSQVQMARLEERVSYIQRQIQTGILPGAEKNIEQLRSELLVMETKNSALMASQQREVNTMADRLINITARIRVLEHKVIVAGPRTEP